ncbi:MAG: hypothetical protein IKX58_07275, partial [Clostridia bacterium]|nr:hypothetical protein [Clostridia bacterium]
MKKNDNSFAGKVIAALDKLGLTAGELAIVQDYLDSDPRDESILDAITPRDLSTLQQDSFKLCYRLAGDLSDKKAHDTDSLSAFANIAFAIGHSSAYKMFTNYYSTHYNSIRNTLPDDKFVAIAAGYGASCFMGNRNRLVQDSVWLYAEDHPRTVIEALKYCGATGGETRLFVEMALFCQLYNKYPMFVEQGGIEDTLKLFDTEFIPGVIQAFMASLTGLTTQETALIMNYVKSDISPELPLDSDLSALCEKAGIERLSANLPVVSAMLLRDRSDICARMLRIYSLCDIGCIFDVACRNFHRSDVDVLLHQLEASPSFSYDDKGRYFLCAVYYDLDGTAKRIYNNDKECLDKSLEIANAQNVVKILEKLKKLDPNEYKRRIDPDGEYAEKLREKTARSISGLVTIGNEELYDFIIGKINTEKLLSYLDSYKNELSTSYLTYHASAAEQVLTSDAIIGRLRIVKLMGGYYYDVLKSLTTSSKYNSDISYQAFERLFDDFDLYAVPRKLQYDSAAGMYDSCYSDDTKASLRDCLCR